jgi:hypothetical protein
MVDKSSDDGGTCQKLAHETELKLEQERELQRKTELKLEQELRREQEGDKRKNRTQILILLLGVLIGASGYLANSLFLWNTSVNKDKYEISEGLYFDVSSIEGYLIATDREFLANPDERYIFVQGTPLYPDNGLYFAYLRDIPRLDRKIGQDTFTFYNHLLAAERDRDNIYEIQRRGDVRDLTKAELRRQQILTANVAREVNASVSFLLPLKQELAAAI